MRRIKTKKKLLCAALAAALTWGAVCPIYAAQPEAPGAAGQEPADTTQQGPTDIPPDQPPAEAEGSGAEQLTEEQLAEFYGDSVFIGDSIMQGFQNYSAGRDTFVHEIEFLAATSYSANNALKPVKGKNVHPKYKDKKYQLWDAVPLVGKKRAFILLGTNDLVSRGPERSRDKYKELIDKVLETSPDLEIHIISVTYTLKGKEKGCLCNSNIDAYNALLQEMAEENGWGYVDLCTPLSDGEGNLAEEYCSDKFVHLTRAAYKLWEPVLADYAGAIQTAETETGSEVETTCIQADS